MTEPRAAGPQLFLEGEKEPVPYPLLEGITRIGRSSRNTIPLRDSSVSRFHCFLVRTGDDVRLYDASSDNGTNIGEEKAQDGRILRDGDVLALGRSRLRFAVPAPASAPEPQAAAAPAPLPAPPASPEPAAVMTAPAEPQPPAAPATPDVRPDPETAPPSRFEAAPSPEPARVTTAPALPGNSRSPRWTIAFGLAAATLGCAAFLARGWRDDESEPAAPEPPRIEEAGKDEEPIPEPAPDPAAERLKALEAAVASLTEKLDAFAGEDRDRASAADQASQKELERLATRLGRSEDRVRELAEERTGLDERIAKLVEESATVREELVRTGERLDELARAREKEEPPEASGPDESGSRTGTPLDSETIQAIERAALWLLAAQAADGSWSLQPDGPPDLATTAAAAIALDRARDLVPRSSDRDRIQAAFRNAVNFVGDHYGAPSDSAGYIDREIGQGVEIYLVARLLCRAYRGLSGNVREKVRGALAGLVRRIDRILGSTSSGPEVQLIGYSALSEIRASGVAVELSYDLDDTLERLQAPWIEGSRAPVLVAGRRYAGEHFLRAWVVADALAPAERPEAALRLGEIRSVLLELGNSDGSYTGLEGVTSRSFCTSAALLVLTARSDEKPAKESKK